MKSYLIAIVILVVLGALAWGIQTAYAPVAPQSSDMTEGRVTSLRAFFDENLAALSPEKPVLGGTFYVTDLEAHGGAGTIRYEDGHNAYVADFLYSVDEQGGVRVETFTVRK